MCFVQVAPVTHKSMFEAVSMKSVKARYTHFQSCGCTEYVSFAFTAVVPYFWVTRDHCAYTWVCADHWVRSHRKMWWWCSYIVAASPAAAGFPPIAGQLGLREGGRAHTTPAKEWAHSTLLASQLPGPASSWIISLALWSMDHGLGPAYLLEVSPFHTLQETFM